MTLKLDPLEKSITRLRDGLSRYQADETDEQIRDGLIHRVKFTYESALKLIRRHMAIVAPEGGKFESLAFQDVILAAVEDGLLLGHWPEWRSHRSMRGQINHTYQEHVAVSVVGHIPAFLTEAEHLLEALRKRHAAPEAAPE